MKNVIKLINVIVALSCLNMYSQTSSTNQNYKGEQLNDTINRTIVKSIDFKSFIIENCDYVTDIDGQIYQAVLIGTQCWMAENLNVTHYRNGDIIPNVTDHTQWSYLNTGAYCNYDTLEFFAATYGRLYNWYAVNDSRNICPEEWYVPGDNDWKRLEINLGMSQKDADTNGWRGNDEGGKMKTTGTSDDGNGLWYAPNTGASNVSGFSGLPGGYRYNGGFNLMGIYGYWWSSTEYYSDAWFRYLSYYNSDIGRGSGFSKKYGFSVRCIADVNYNSINKNDQINKSINIYPNPTNDKITIENKSINKISNEMFSIYNIQGQLLMNQPMLQNKSVVNISDLAKGVYIVKIYNSKGVIVKRVIKD